MTEKPETGAATAPEQGQHAFEFIGNTSERVPIILKNLLFNILTLSLYRFWARTHVRRYIWQNIRFMGDPLEYTGTGGELFKGFLIVMFLVIIPLFSLISVGQLLAERGNSVGSLLILVSYLVIFFLIPYGYYRALRYRMSRTTWRGIRGSQQGSAASYAWSSIGYGFLAGISLGLALPYVENQLWKKESNNRAFGTGQFLYEADSGPLYGAFFIGIALSIVGMVLFMVPFMAMVKQGSVDARAQAGMVGWFMLAYLLLFVTLAFAFSLYDYTKVKHFANNSFFEDATFAFSGTWGQFIGLMVGNLLIVVLTFGIAYPLMQMRVVRYVMGNLALEGRLDLAKIGQSTDEVPATGEGLADAFDMGTI